MTGRAANFFVFKFDNLTHKAKVKSSGEDPGQLEASSPTFLTLGSIKQSKTRINFELGSKNPAWGY